MLLVEYGSGNKSTGVSLTSSGADQRLAQRVTVKRDAPIGTVSLYLKKIGSPNGYLYVEVQTDSSNLPSGSTFDNGTSAGVPMSDVGTDYGWVDFTFDDNARPKVNGSDDFHIILRASNYTYSSGSTEIVWGADQSYPHYRDGEGETYNSSWSNLSTDTDFIFRLYSKSRSVYSAISNVEALIKNFTDEGALTHNSKVTATRALDFEELVSNEIDSWLSGAGFGTPISDSNVLTFLEPYATSGVAMYCELTQPTSGFRGNQGADTRVGGFRTLYYELRDSLRNENEMVDALVGLGLGRTTYGKPGEGLTGGGIDYDEHEDYEDDIDDEELVAPTFSRGMWDNV